MFSFSLSFLQGLWSKVIRYDEEGGFPEASNISGISLEIRALGQLEFVSYSSSCYFIFEEELKVKHWLTVFYGKTKKSLIEMLNVLSNLIYCAGLVWVSVPLHLGCAEDDCRQMILSSQTLWVSCGKAFDVWLRIVFGNTGSPAAALLQA